MTCPLEVVKTRLQSSVATFGPTETVCVSKVRYPHSHTFSVAAFNSTPHGALKQSVITAGKSSAKNLSIYSLLRYATCAVWHSICVTCWKFCGEVYLRINYCRLCCV